MNFKEKGEESGWKYLFFLGSLDVRKKPHLSNSKAIYHLPLKTQTRTAKFYGLTIKSAFAGMLYILSPPFYCFICS